MAASCPNKNHPVWRELEARYGKELAYYAYDANGEDIPSLEDGIETINVFLSQSKPKPFGLQYANMLRQRYYSNFYLNNTEYYRDKNNGNLFKDNKQISEEDYDAAYEEFKREQGGYLHEEVYNSMYNAYQEGKISRTNFLEYVKETYGEPTEKLESLRVKINQFLRFVPFKVNVKFDESIPYRGLWDKDSQTITLNPLLLESTTFGHETFHILFDLLQSKNPSILQAGLKQLEGSKIADKVREDYSSLTGTDLDNEILAQAVETEVEKLFETDEQRSKWSKWLARFFYIIRSWTGIHKDAVRQMARTIVYSNVKVGTIQDLKNSPSHAEMQSKAKTIQEELDALETEQLRGLGDMVDKSIKSLERRIASYSRSPGKSRAHIKELETIYQRLSKATDPKTNNIVILRALGDFVKTSLEEINYVNSLLLERKRLESLGKYTFTAKDLDLMRQQATGYGVLDEISSELSKIKLPEGQTRFRANLSEKAEKQLKNSLGVPFRNYLDEWMDAIKDAQSKRNDIINAYKEKGIETIAKVLSPYNSITRVRRADQLERQYLDLKKEGKSADKDGDSVNVPKEEYIKNKMEKESNKLDILTQKHIQAELLKASRDISTLRRWIDSVYDSPDLVLSSAVRLFEQANFKANERRMDIKHRLLQAIKGIEDQVGKDLITDPMKMYEFMLEKDSKGNPTGYILKHIKSSFYTEMDKKLEIARKEAEGSHILNGKLYGPTHKAYNNPKARDLTFEEIETYVSSARRAFYEENAPTSRKQREELIKDYFEYARKLHDEGKLSAASYKFFRQEYELKQAAMSNPELWQIVTPFKNFRKQGVEEEAIVLLEDWWRDNRIKYSTIKEKWINQEYEKINNLPDTDPKKIFYKTITELSDEIESELPYAHQLQGRLPGILKDNFERIADKQGAVKVIKEGAKELLGKHVNDTEKGDSKNRIELLDAEDDPVHYLPVYHTTDLRAIYADEYDNLSSEAKANISKEDYVSEKYNRSQSFDLGSIYYSYFKMGSDFAEKAKILPELEMTKYFINNREYTKRNGDGNVIIDAISRLKGGEREATIKGRTAKMAEQFNDWMEAMVYGVKHKDEGDFNLFGYKIDKAKLLDNINKYTSVGMLGLNVVAGVSNLNLGEAMNMIEAIGGEYFNMKDLVFANGFYFKNMGNIIKDIGVREPEGFINVLNEVFDTLNEHDDGNFRENSRLKKLANWDTMFFISNMGEHTMQSTVMLAMLHAMPAKDKEGNVIGNMLEHLSVKDGKMVVDEKVNNFNENEQVRFKENLKRVLSASHGEYYGPAQGAWQRLAILRMAMLFRKFVVPGFKRRWGKEEENNLKGTITEGYYRTFGRFFMKLVSEMKALGLAGTWNDMKDREKANLKRFFAEVGFLMAAIVLVRLTTSALKGDDDDDPYWLEALSYLALRQRSELAFFLFPPSAMQILRSPAATVTMAETAIDFFGELAYPLFSGTFEYPRYEQGNRKGQLKLMKPAINLIPGVKQYYRLWYIDDQLTWFTR